MRLQITDVRCSGAVSLTAFRREDFLILFDWQVIGEQGRADADWPGPFTVEIGLQGLFTTTIETSSRRVGFLLPREVQLQSNQVQADIRVSAARAGGQPAAPIATAAPVTFSVGTRQADPEMLRTVYSENQSELRRTRTLYESFLVAETVGFAVLADKAHDVTNATPRMVFGFSLALFALTIILSFLICELAKRYHGTTLALQNIERATGVRAGNWTGELVPSNKEFGAGPSAKFDWFWAYLLLGYTVLLSVLAIATLSRSTMKTVLWALILSFAAVAISLYSRGQPFHVIKPLVVLLALLFALMAIITVWQQWTRTHPEPGQQSSVLTSPLPGPESGQQSQRALTPLLPGAGATPGTTGPPVSLGGVAVLYVLSIALFALGLLVAVFSRSKLSKAAGAVVAVTGLSILPIKELTLFEKLVDKLELIDKLDLKLIDKLNLSVNVNGNRNTNGNGNVEALQVALESDATLCDVGPFLDGLYQLEALKSEQTSDNRLSVSTQARLAQVGCLQKLIRSSPTGGSDDVGLLIVIGHVDKRELHGNLQRKYGSNITLAYLRALVVRDYLVSQHPGWKNRVIVISAGPRNVGFQVSNKDLADDRHVEVLPYRLRLRTTTPAQSRTVSAGEAGFGGGSGGGSSP